MIFLVALSLLAAVTWITGTVILPRLISFTVRFVQYSMYFIWAMIGFVVLMSQVAATVSVFIREVFHVLRPYIRECRAQLRLMVHDSRERRRARRADRGRYERRQYYEHDDDDRNNDWNGNNQRLYPDLSNADSFQQEDNNFDDNYDSYSSTPSDVNMDNAPSEPSMNTERVNVTPTAPVWEDDLDQDNLCVVCLDRERNTAVFPCGHTHLCGPCTRAVVNGRNVCPICQTPIVEYRSIFL